MAIAVSSRSRWLHRVEPVDSARHMGVPLGGRRHPEHRPAGRRRAADVTAGLRDHRTVAALSHRKVEPRGLHRPRLLHRRRVGNRLQRAGPAAGRRRHAQSFKQYVERPATLCIPLLLATFSLGNGAQIYRADFFTVPTDFWLSLYWLLLCGTLIYLLGYGVRACWCCARTRGRGGSPTSTCSRRPAAFWPAPCASSPPSYRRCRQLEGGKLVWVFACMCGAVFALASAHSWRIKTKWFTKVSR